MPRIVRFQTSHEEPYPLEVKGESNYKDNLEKVSGYLGEDEGVDSDDFIAYLILDDANPTDLGNAVRIEIDNLPVGYLSKTAARRYREKLIELSIPNVTGACFASIKGGFILKSGEQADFGVRLDIELEELQIAPAVPVKPITTSVQPLTAQAVSLQSIQENPPKKKDRRWLVVAIITVTICSFAFLLQSLFQSHASSSTMPPVINAQTQMAETAVIAARTQVALAQTQTAAPIIPTFTPTDLPTITPAPQPIILTGSGDSVVDVNKWYGAALLSAVYNGGSNFIVENYDANGNRIDLLINTIGHYKGVRPLDFRVSESTARFQVTASGPWELQILPLENITRVIIPGTYQGNGDDVIALNGGIPDLLEVDASHAYSNFIIYSYSTSADLLVNEIAPYSGTVILPSNTIILEIIAEGNWSIQITTK